VPHRFDVVAVGVEDERAVVVACVLTEALAARSAHQQQRAAITGPGVNIVAQSAADPAPALAVERPTVSFRSYACPQ
jgi:hypothetical protein